MDSITVSIIIPAYNESQRLPETLSTLNEYLSGADFESEVLVVDDGSTDGTSEVVAAPARVLRNPTNHGKGYAVRQGMLEATGGIRIFMDADLSVPPDEIGRLLEQFEAGHDIVIGSRNVHGAEVDSSSRPYRRTMGHIFNRFVRMFAVGDISDTQCGFKGFKREVAENLFSRQKLDGFAFDVEILYLASRLGYRTFEMPIKWVDSATTKIRPMVDSLIMLKDLMRIRRLHRGEDWSRPGGD